MKETVSFIQKKSSPATGVVRYSTRVSLFTGEGSKIHKGSQEAGLLILGRLNEPDAYTSTFIGIVFDRQGPDAPGGVIIRVGNGIDGFRTERKVIAEILPFEITEGEYAISVDHDVKGNALRRIRINGFDITNTFLPQDLKQPISNGLFGVRSVLNPQGSGVTLQQFYWYYRVEVL
jgi:hypothetical protein